MDYGIVLKANSGTLVLKKQYAVIKALMALADGNSNGYVMSSILNLLVVFYQKNKNLPTWQMMEKYSAMYNEESGEISFGTLARTILGHTNKTEVKHLSNYYVSINKLREIDDEMMEDNGKKFKQDKNWRKEYKEDDPMVVETTAFLKARIRELKSNKFTVYSGKSAGFKNKVAAAKHQVKYR